MKKPCIIFGLAMFCIQPLKAQLTVDIDYNVLLGDDAPPAAPLTVGPYAFGQQTGFNCGVAASPTIVQGKTNVGIEGYTVCNSSYPYWYGIRGIVIPYGASTNKYHYGVSGILSGLGSASGTGVLGSSVSSSYLSPPAINGKYAGYFLGDVYTSGTLTASQVLTTSDIRLKDNIVLLEEKEDGETTLNKLVSLQVLQYNLKDKGDYDIPEEARKQIEEECPEVLLEIEKRKGEYASRLHFGVSAQQLQDVYPVLVTEGQDGYLCVNYLEMLPIIIRSLQELKHEISEVKVARATLDTDGESIAKK